MDPARVLIAEDDPALRQAMADLIRSEPDLEFVAEAPDADGAIEAAAKERPDVALVDVKMPGGGGPRAAREIRQVSPQTRVIALSAYEDRRTVLEMLRSGVVGYIVKGTPADQIIDTIRRSMRGQGSLSVEVTADVIHELTMLLERSETLAQELQRLNQTKSELIQILSHELFTPLTIIQGYASMFGEQWDRLGRDAIQDAAAGIAAAGERIKRLVGNLSAAARLDRDGLEVTTKPMDLGPLLEDARSEFTRGAERLRLPDQSTLAGVQVWADLDLAVRAMVVVIENALALSEAEVEIEVAPGEGEVAVSISDRGPGIPEAQASSIFDAFTQTDQSTTRTHEGLGIGLFLARRIMDAHGGQIEYRPRPGGGSTFVLSFPAFHQGTGAGVS